ncbi:MAG TPA: EcsC family protein [Egibacteraceae bacterium]|nr:EcsC family protein [Egibacteraceae bacterium]
MGDFLKDATSGSGVLARTLDRLIEAAQTRPATVLNEAAKRGIPLYGHDAAEALASLRLRPVIQLDPLASSFIRSNALIAGAQGFATNVGGVLTLPIALPADTVGSLALIVRATSAVMNSYGFETETEDGAVNLRIGLLAAAGVNKVLVSGTNILVSELSSRAILHPSGRELAGALTRSVADGLGRRLTHRQLARAAPIVGGAVGAGVNIALVRATAGRARRHYRDLLLQWQANQALVTPALTASSAPSAPLR